MDEENKVGLDELEDKPLDDGKSDDGLEIEIVDDTPAQDRGREPMPKDIVEELEKDDLDEYSEKVKKRMSQMKKVWHDERREKERAAREREEAIEFARRAYEENKQLKSQLHADKKAHIDTLHAATKNDYQTAREKYRAAVDAGDADAITDAQENLTKAQIALREIERYKPTLQAEQPVVQSNQQTEPTVEPDERAKQWRARNTWYGVDDEMTALALGVHQKLVRSGVDPRTQADVYYRQLDASIKKRFPEYFGNESSSDDPPTRGTPRNKVSVVAPVSRNMGPRRVQLTPSQVAVAKKMGISNEAYAREVLKLQDNGDR